MVTYNPIPGRIYDITCIVTALCDYEGYENFYRSRVDEQGLKGTTLKLYEFIRGYDIALDDDICFLFRYHLGNPRFIGEYLGKCGVYRIFDSMNSFIMWIRNLGSNLLLPEVCEYLKRYAGKHAVSLIYSSDSEPSEIYTYVSALELEPRWKLAVLSIFLNTSEFVSKLADVLVRCEAILKDINIRFQKHIGALENQKYDVQDLNRIWKKALPTTDLINLDDSVYSFSFLNDSMFFYLDAYDPVWIILGCYAEEYGIKNTSSEQLDIMVIGKAVGDSNRLRILELLENRPMYATELATELQVAHTSLFYHVNLLCDAGLINMYTQGRKTYYTINYSQIGKISYYLSNYYEKSKRRKEHVEETANGNGN